MDGPKRIGLFYSLGPHFGRALRQVRAAHPHARITALVPPGFPKAMLEHADDCLTVPPPPHGLRNAAALARVLREQRFDRLVVLFDSPRLRVLARLSGARERWCCGPDGRHAALEGGVLGALLRGLGRKVRGHLTWARIWLEIRLSRGR